MASGITEIIFIIRRKCAIEDHFDNAIELEVFLESWGKLKLAGVSGKFLRVPNFRSCDRKESKGYEDAFLQAWHLIGHEPVVVLYGDDIIVDSSILCFKQMMKVFEKHCESVLALTRILHKDVSRYGVVRASKIDRRAYSV